MKKIQIKGKNYDGIVSFGEEDSPDILQLSAKKNVNAHFYNDFYNSNHLQKLRRYQASRLIKKLGTSLLPSPTILEIGCGNGIFINEILKVYKGNILGIDSYLKSETKNKKRACLYEFKGKTFECIILLDVFEHFEDNESALKKITSHLSENGLLILKVPNKNSLYYKISKILSIFNTASFARLYQLDFPPQHFFYYNEKSLRKLCENAGFEYMNHFYMSEVPLRGLYERLWGLSPLLRCAAIPLICLYNLLAFGSLKDSLVICFSHNTIKNKQGEMQCAK